MSSSFTTRFVAALTARNSEQPSRDTETALSNCEASGKMIDELMSKPEFKEIASKLIKSARIAHATQDRENFVAVKALVKVVNALRAIAHGQHGLLDGYTRTIVKNLVKNELISTKAAMVSLSKSISFDETDRVYTLPARWDCSVGTASTQMSSTRMMLLTLGMGKVSKGKRGDEFGMLDNERSRALLSLFTEKVIEQIEAEEQGS